MKGGSKEKEGGAVNRGTQRDLRQLQGPPPPSPKLPPKSTGGTPPPPTPKANTKSAAEKEIKAKLETWRKGVRQAIGLY
eukprot:1275078-Ditylum_brightwellii.AAC.1